METFLAILARKVSEALTAADLPQAGGVTPATDPRFGDYQSNAALILGKQLGENPRGLAQRILDGYDSWDLCDPPTIAGAGFINFTLRPEAIAAKTATNVEAIGKALRAGTNCGSCLPELKRIVHEHAAHAV